MFPHNIFWYQGKSLAKICFEWPTTVQLCFVAITYICKKAFRTKEKLRQHQKYVNCNKFLHQCVICSSKFYTRRDWKLHIESQHPEFFASNMDAIRTSCNNVQGDQSDEKINKNEKPIEQILSEDNPNDKDKQEINEKNISISEIDLKKNQKSIARK